MTNNINTEGGRTMVETCDILDARLNCDYREQMASMRFSEEDKVRMTERLEMAAAASGCAASGPTFAGKVLTGGTPRQAGRHARGRMRRFAIVGSLAAALAVGAVGLAASGGFVTVGNMLDDLFNGAPAPTQIVDRIGCPVGAVSSSNGVTITADAVAGDAENLMVVFSIAKDDGTPFEQLKGVEALENGVLPLMFRNADLSVDAPISGAHGGSYFYDADPADNAIQFVERLSFAGDGAPASIIGKTARADLADLVLFDDANDRLVDVAEGAWRLKFEVAYEDVARSLPAGAPFELNGSEATVTRLTVSPVAVNVEYEVKATLAWEDQPDGRMSEANEAALDSMLDLGRVLVTMDDGSVLEVDDLGGGALDASAVPAKCVKSIGLPSIIDPAHVASVTICDTVVVAG